MNQQPDISVIVPCFNADRYLSICLESLKAQKVPQIEMIFIDDGSTDATGAILDAFAAQEPRARVAHIPNAGVSAARNRGLEMAAGKYIAFVDADDALEENSFVQLWREAKRTGAQIISANHMIFDMERGQRIPVETEPIVQQSSEIVREIIHMHRIFNNIWNKLYDRSLFDGLRLDEGVRIGEDALLNLQLYRRARRIVHLQDYTYVYRVHSKSAMATIKGYSEAHQPMLRSMSAILLKEQVKELYFRDFLQSCIWRDEKEKGIWACMRGFNVRIRPLVLEGICEEKIPQTDLPVLRCIKLGWFPAFYVLMRVREKLTGQKWGIRR